MRNFQTGLFFLLSILLSSVSFAQVNNYSFSTSSGTFTPIAGGTVLVSATDPAPVGNDSAAMDDFTYAEQPLPFPFWFGTSYQNSFRVNSNGWMGFGSSSTNTSTPISSTINFNGIIAPIALDLMGLSSTTGTITSGSNTITGVANTSLVKNGDQNCKEHHEQGTYQHNIKCWLFFGAYSTTAGGNGHKISQSPGNIEGSNKKGHTNTP